MIDLRHLSHGFLRKTLFSDVNLRLMPNERYGIVGANGSGKSTLLRMIAGELEPDDGEIVIESHKKFFRIGQDFSLDDEASIIETAMLGQREVFLAMKKQEELLSGVTRISNLSEELAVLEEIIRVGEGYRLRPHAETILAGLGIKAENYQKPLKVLSGGYKWRVYLAQALVKKPDILMLDEPTNHLDIVSIRWLEQFLCNYDGLILLVSHDRRFLDNVTSKILDVDFGTITEYTGNYSAFFKARRLFLLQKEKEIEAQEREIAKKQAFIERFRAKATKARQAQSRIKQLEKIEVIEPVKSSRIHPHFRFDIDEPGSKEVVTVNALSKSYGEKKIIDNFSFTINRYEKVAIIGPNGSGKSTLIKALAEEFPECARAIKWGFGVNYGYFAQDCGSQIKAANTSALEWLWQFCADKPQSFVQGLLGRMLFTGEDAKKTTKNLSGGELARLNFAYLMLKKPNVLILDEPTNHLDLEAIDSLVSALNDFKGTLITVSHDRNFIDSIFSRIIEIGDDGVRDYLGSYSEFVAFKERDFLDAKNEMNLNKKSQEKEPKISKLSYEEQKAQRSHVQKLKRRIEKIMLMVEEYEEHIESMEKQFLDPKFYEEHDHQSVAFIEAERQELKEKLSVLIEEWETSENELSRLSVDD